MDARTFFTRFAELLAGNPPTKDDAPMVEKMKKFGIVAGQPFDLSKLDAPALEGINGAPKATQDAIVAAAKGTGGAEIRNGWTFHLDLGRYGTNYGKRAFVAWLGLDSDAPEDEIQMSTRLDGGGKPLDGANKYVLHFDTGKTPPSERSNGGASNGGSGSNGGGSNGGASSGAHGDASNKASTHH